MWSPFAKPQIVLVICIYFQLWLAREGKAVTNPGYSVTGALLIPTISAVNPLYFGISCFHLGLILSIGYCKSHPIYLSVVLCGFIRAVLLFYYCDSAVLYMHL